MLDTVEELRSSPQDMAGYTLLTDLEASLNEITFISLPEWLDLLWPDMEATEKEPKEVKDYLIGAYAAWYAHYLKTVECCGPDVMIRRLSGERTGMATKDTVVKPRKVQKAMASIAPLGIPACGIDMLCASCTLHTRSGKIMGAVISWLTGANEYDYVKADLEAWARYWGADQIIYLERENGWCEIEANETSLLLPYMPAEKGQIIPLFSS